MTRAYKALFNFDLNSAIRYNFLFPIPMLWTVYIICRRYIKHDRQLENIMLIVSVLLFIIRWITILIIYY